MRRPSPSLRSRTHRPLLAALVLSLLLHGLLGLSVGRQWLATDASAAVMPPPRPDPIRFELVETPESAAREEPAEDSEFFSNRNTRSQQLTPLDDERPVNRRPDVQGNGETHDLRPVATAPRLGVPDPVVVPPVPPSPQAARPSQPSPETAPRPRETASRRESSVRLEPQREPELPVPTEAEGEETPEPRPESRRQPQTPEAAAPQAPRDPRDPSAFVTDDRVARGKPSLSAAEQEELARAEALGEFSYEATRHFFADYFFDLKEKVENAWVILLSTRYRNLDPSKAALTFKIYPDGSIRELQVLTAESKGDDLFPLVCSLAVRNTAPFGPVPYDAMPYLPEGVRGLPLNVRMNFNYN
jgi:hypothetical protein